MAQPVAVTYTVASGPIHAGRFAGGAFAGAVALGDAAPGGGWAVQQSAFAGAVGLDDAVTAGGFTTPFNARVAIWGQSNARGRALRTDLSASPLSADPGLAAYDAGTFARVWLWNGTAYTQMQPSVYTGTEAGQFGPEFGLAVRWMRETTAGNLYVDKQASSGVSIANFAPSGGYEYAEGRAERGQADAWLSSAGVTLQREALLWVQGETDAAQTQSWYQTRLSDILSALIAAGHISSTSKVVLAQMHPNTDTYGPGVFNAKAAIAAGSPSTVVTSQCPWYMNAGDNIHYSARGQVQIAYDAFERIFGAAHIDV